MNGIARLDERFHDIAKRLEDLSYQLDDIIEDIRNERDGIEYNPGLLEQIEERLDFIYRLKRKYGSTIEDVLEYCRKAER
ncbi:MAG: DNA repair protein RecN, partial [Anaerolineae bacterium]|nr:DNA repair protein RecN [Anaerolineae bacterium]